MKKLPVVSFVVFLSVALYAQQSSVSSAEYPWHLLEQGKVAYEAREFGEALLLFGQAREMRKTQIAAQYDYLFAALKPQQVRAAGDLIADVYRVLEKRQDYEACAILDKIFLTHPPAYFNKSISALLDWFRRSGVYPECDYLIGKVYELEGELSQSRRFYQEAWEAREFLYIPDMRF